MSANSKKSLTTTFLLILLGLTALFAGAKWLTVLVPVALFVWYTGKPRLGSGRN
jgi:hypothetical protein